MLRGTWNNQVIREITEFPFGLHDDIVDALGLLGRRAAMMAGKFIDGPMVEIPIEGTLQEKDGKVYTTQTLEDLWDEVPERPQGIIRI